MDNPNSIGKLFVAIALVLSGCTATTPHPTVTNTALPPTSTNTLVPPTDTATATVTLTATDTATSVPPTDTPTNTSIPPTSTSTPTKAPPAKTKAPAATAIPPSTAAPTSAPPSSGSAPTIAGISLVSREPQAVTLSVSFSGLQPNQKYNAIAYSADCPNGCARFGIIHSGLFNYFTPTSGNWTIQIKVGIDSVFCQGGNTTASNTITIDLGVGVSLNADYSATFPLANTWCG